MATLPARSSVLWRLSGGKDCSGAPSIVVWDGLDQSRVSEGRTQRQTGRVSGRTIDTITALPGCPAWTRVFGCSTPQRRPSPHSFPPVGSTLSPCHFGRASLPQTRTESRKERAPGKQSKDCDRDSRISDRQYQSGSSLSRLHISLGSSRILIDAFGCWQLFRSPCRPGRTIIIIIKIIITQEPRSPLLQLAKPVQRGDINTSNRPLRHLQCIQFHHLLPRQLV